MVSTALDATRLNTPCRTISQADQRPYFALQTFPQVIDSITRLSSGLRNAADVCDNFVRIVARSNPIAVANVLGQPATGGNVGRNNDFNSFLSGGAGFLNANGAGGNPLGQQATTQAPPHHAQSALGASGHPSSTTQQGSGGQQVSPGLNPEDYDANGKKLSKRQKKLLRKARDPDAPKRPPSAYLLFQNEVRADMRERFPEMPYKEILGKVSEAWKNLSEADRKIYQDKTNEEMKRWTVEKKDHEANGLPFPDDQDEYADSSALVAAAASAGPIGGGSTADGQGSSNSASRSTSNHNGASLAPASLNSRRSSPPAQESSKKRKDGSSSKKEKRSRH